MISAFLLLFLSSVFLGYNNTPSIRDANANLNIAIKNWKLILKLRDQDRNLARSSQRIYKALKHIDNLNSTLDGLRTWCSSDPEPYGMASIAAISKATKLAQELSLKSINIITKTLTTYYLQEEAKSQTLEHYRQTIPNSCDIPGNLSWALSSTKPIVKIHLKNAGACIFGGDSKRSWRYCNKMVNRNEI